MWGTLGQPATSTSARQNLELEIGPFTLRQATYDAGAHVIEHTHNRPSIVYGVGGPCIESRGGPRIVRRRLTFLPTGYTHSLDYVAPTQVFVVETDPASRHALQLGQAGVATPLPAALYDSVWDILLRVQGLADLPALSNAVTRFWTGSASYLLARQPRWLAALLDQLHVNWESPPSATAIARQLGFSPQFLCRAFKRATGLTMRQYNQAIRLDYARGLLWGSGQSVSEIAGVTGFSDQSHLTRVLRDRMGETPASLRSRSFVPEVPLRHSYARA